VRASHGRAPSLLCSAPVEQGGIVSLALGCRASAAFDRQIFLCDSIPALTLAPRSPGPVLPQRAPLLTQPPEPGPNEPSGWADTNWTRRPPHLHTRNLRPLGDLCGAVRPVGWKPWSISTTWPKPFSLLGAGLASCAFILPFSLIPMWELDSFHTRLEQCASFPWCC
jgi:hypothetical protein